MSEAASPMVTLLRRSAVVGAVGSVLAHAVLALSLVPFVIPDTGFELTFPIEVELGLTDGTEVAVAPAPAVEPPDPPAGDGTELAAGAAGPGPLDAGVARDAAIGDGGDRPDAGRRRRRDAGVDAAPPLVAEEGATGTGGPAGEGRSPVEFLPAGAQVALRVDLDRVRASEVRPEVEGLLAALPDWEALLSGSGVEPVRDFSRVLVATPNFDRARIVVAGRLTPEARASREVAETMAAAHGETLRWRDVSGVPTARWATGDSTPRSVALLGPRHFVVAADADLERVLLVAASRARAGTHGDASGAAPGARGGADEAPGEPASADERDERAGGASRGTGAEAALDPADALLSMGAGEALSVEVEGMRRFFARAPCPIPLRGRFALSETATGVDLALEVRFDDADEASRAERCYLRYVGLARALFPPLAPPLGRLSTTTEEALLSATSSMSLAELRAILSLASDRFAARRRAPSTAPGSAGGSASDSADPPAEAPGPSPPPAPVPGPGSPPAASSGPAPPPDPVPAGASPSTDPPGP